MMYLPLPETTCTHCHGSGCVRLYALDIESCGAIEFADCATCGGAGKATVVPETFDFSYPF